MLRSATRLALLACLLATAAASAIAQPLQIPALDQLSGVGNVGAQEGRASFQAKLEIDPDGLHGKLTIVGTIAPQWHIYSLTQEAGGPIKTTIRLDDESQVALKGEFTPQSAPHIDHDEVAFPNLALETHEGRVVWTAPVEVSATGLNGQVVVRGTVRYQACREGLCLPPTRAPFEAATVVGAAAPGAPTRSEPTAQEVAPLPATGEFSAEGVEWQVSASSLAIAPGGTVELEFRATPEDGWHVYEYEATDPQTIGYKPTLIGVRDAAGLQVSPPATGAALIEDEQDFGVTKLKLRYYEGSVVWRVTLKAPQDAAVGLHEVTGAVGYLACSGAQCKMPIGFEFRVPISVAAAPAQDARTITLVAAKYGDAAAASANAPAPTLPPPAASRERTTPPAPGEAAAPAPVAVADSPFSPVLVNAKEHSVWGWLLLAFVEGLILNIMPCVLPVVGLKVFSFIEQAGHNRWRALQLNLWYTLGMLSVFWLLAIAAAFLGQGWGAQFENETFKITLIAVVFVCALSFLGVWELPIPGFASTSTATGLSTKEGASGAYFKGVFSTVLATPCAGPLLGTILAWALTQSTPMIFAIFTSVGLGMASPYVVLGLFPQLAKFLPRPGAWMETFKQFLGFLLLATVVFIFYSVNPANFVPVLTLLVGLSAACWWVGRLSATAEPPQRFRAWGIAISVAALAGLFAFGKLDQVWNNFTEDRLVEIDWQPFDRGELDSLLAEGRTVMVDFTANWCVTCQSNKKIVLDRESTKKLLDDYAVTPILADKTDEESAVEANELLRQLGNASTAIPYLAIFPGADPYRPIVLEGPLSREELAAAIRQASSVQTAMRPAVAR